MARWQQDMSSVVSLIIAQGQALEVRVREQGIAEYALREQTKSTRRLLASVEREWRAIGG